MALGAERADVLGLMLRKGLRSIVPGVIAGSVLAFVAARMEGRMLVHVEDYDPLTFESAAVFLALVAGLACHLPALRATRVDPTLALRNE